MVSVTALTCTYSTVNNCRKARYASQNSTGSTLMRCRECTQQPRSAHSIGAIEASVATDDRLKEAKATLYFTRWQAKRGLAMLPAPERLSESHFLTYLVQSSARSASIAMTHQAELSSLKNRLHWTSCKRSILTDPFDKMHLGEAEVEYDIIDPHPAHTVGLPEARAGIWTMPSSPKQH